MLRYNFFLSVWEGRHHLVVQHLDDFLCKKHPKTRKCDWDVGKERYRVIKCKMSIWTNRVARTRLKGHLCLFSFWDTWSVPLWQLEEHWTPPETPLGSPPLVRSASKERHKNFFNIDSYDSKVCLGVLYLFHLFLISWVMHWMMFSWWN